MFISVQFTFFFLVPTLSDVKVTQSFPTHCDPMDYTVQGILQARILEWVAVPFSRDLPNPGIKPRSPTLQVDSLPAEPQGKPWGRLEERNQIPYDYTVEVRNRFKGLDLIDRVPDELWTEVRDTVQETMPKPLTVWLTTNWKILKEMGISDHLTRLLRNL